LAGLYIRFAHERNYRRGGDSHVSGTLASSSDQVASVTLFANAPKNLTLKITAKNA